jgi:hypothetical protein
MQLIVPPPEAIPTCLRAMKMVASEDKPLSPATTNMLMGVQRVLLHTDIALDSLEPIDPAEVAKVLTKPELRTQFIQGAMMLALADGPPTPAQMSRVESLAASLGIERHELHTLRLLADEHTLFFRLHFYRHSHMAEVGSRQFHEEGLLAPLKGLLGMRGLYTNPEQAERYRALEKLRPDTLGFAFTQYLHRNKFGFPGEVGGFPEAGIWHDFGHVLSGYDTDPPGELQMAAFQAGYRRTNAFSMLFFGALTFMAGINVTPLPQKSDPGTLMAQEGMAERMLKALQRGSQVKVDLFDHWDHWAYVEMPLEEARERLGIVPA